MPRNRKININTDKLKLCYKQNTDIFNYFSNLEPDTFIQRNNYTLHLLQVDKTTANVNVIVGDDVLGMFVFNNSERYKGLCFFKFENKALYTFLTRDVCTGWKYNSIPLIEYIADDLNLEFKHITELEIAVDTNFNILAKIRKLIRDYEHYEMFVNGNRITDPKRKIDNYHETFKRSRQRLINPPTLYFEQAKTDAPLMRIYNKSEEINDTSNGKNYIKDWNDFGNIDFYRTEVRLKSNSIKEFLKNESPQLDQLQDPAFLLSIWQTFADRLVKFRRKGGNDITIADLIDA